MTTSTRYTILTNTTGALIANPTVQYGNDWATQVISKTFVAAEIGTNIGQTRDNTDPTVGFLIAQFYGPSIKEVTDINLVRITAATNRNFNAFFTGTADHFAKIGYRIDNSVQGISKLYIFDFGDDAGTRIVATDKLIVTVAIGY